MSHAVPIQSRKRPDVPPGSDLDHALAAAMVPASRSSRFAAVTIDSLIVTLLVILPLVHGVGAQGWHGLQQGDSTTLDNVAASAMLALFGLIIVTGLNIHLVGQHGQSIGKKMLGIKVVRGDGSRAGLGRIVWLRNGIGIVIAIIPWIGGLYSAIDALMIFREPRRCIHDHLADTLVIRA